MADDVIPQGAPATQGLPETHAQDEFAANFGAAFGELPEEIAGEEDEEDAAVAAEEDEAAPAGEPEDETTAAAPSGENAKADDQPPQEFDEPLERALLALRYAKFPDKVIKNASRDELIAWGTEAADRRARTEAALEERAKRIRELEEGQKAPATPPAKPAAVDWTPHLKALAETLGLEPDAASKAFGPVLDAVAQQVRSEFSGRFSEHEKTLQEARAAEGRRQISEQVRRLSEAHPKLRTDEGLVSKLNAKAIALLKSGEYADAASVYDDAAKLVLGPSTAHLSAKRRNGSAPPPEGRVEDRTMDSDDAFMTAMERVEAGDKRGARRAGAQVTWGPSSRRTQKK